MLSTSFGGTAAVLSFRLGGPDGVSVEAAKWAWALGWLGFAVRTVAGEGTADRVVPGLAAGAPAPPEPAEVAAALDGVEVVVVENLCSLPLNPAATAVVAEVLRGRRAVLHHHDLPWQQERFAGPFVPPQDPAWQHVTINERSRRELAERGVAATTIANTFDPDPPPGRRARARRHLGVGPAERRVVQPTRALPRKGVATAVALAEALGAAYWLVGPAEDGYGPELARILAAARAPVHHGGLTDGGLTVADAYAAADVVALPSTWEGFGNPAIESALYRRPLAIGGYPVADELAAYGFRWFDAGDPAPLDAWLRCPDPELIDHNQAVARRHFCLHDLPGRLASLFDSAAWRW